MTNASLVPLNIPSPSISSFSIGPVTIHFYALCILTGIIVGGAWARKRFIARGGESETFETIVLYTLLWGIVGARLYHVITDAQLYFGPGRNPWDALKIWNGGLGIWGGVALGAVAAWWMCRNRKLSFPDFADALVPGLLVAQAIGRLGNWFNQELFGKPTTLPWGLEIDPRFRPEGYEQFATFHPTFLYELLWCLLGAFVLAWLERRFLLGRGKLAASYIVWYTFGRFFIEALRIDPVNTVGGFRLNNYTSAIMFVVGLALLVSLLVKRPGLQLWPFGFPKGKLRLADGHAKTDSIHG